MPYLLLGIGLLAGFFLIGRWYVQASPSDVRRAGKFVGIAALAAIAAFLLFTGRAGAALLPLAGMLPFLIKSGLGYTVMRGLAGRAGGGGSGRGRQSAVRTRYLEMTLDHDSGALDGRILKGRFQDRRLDDLSQAELADLLAEVGDDQQSMQVLEAYLDKRLGPEWRQGAGDAGAAGAGGGGSRGAGGRMTPDEARKILGVANGASREEIEAAYRAEMKRNHPDAGGSTWFAAKINEARAVLLGE